MIFVGLDRTFSAPALLYVSLDDGLELLADIGATQGRDLPTIDIDRR